MTRDESFQLWDGGTAMVDVYLLRRISNRIRNELKVLPIRHCWFVFFFFSSSYHNLCVFYVCVVFCELCIKFNISRGIRSLPARGMHMGCHVEQRRCNIGWLVHRLSYGHSMELVVVEHVGLVVVVECMCYVLVVGLDVVEELAHELDNKLLSRRYIPKEQK